MPKISTGGVSVAGHAEGTMYGEDVYIAGERGPELIVGRRGSEVFPASETARILSAVDDLKKSAYDMPLVPSDIMGYITQENKTTNTENRNITLTINGKGSLDIGQGVSRNDLINYMASELEPALLSILAQEFKEEGSVAYEF